MHTQALDMCCLYYHELKLYIPHLLQHQEKRPAVLEHNSAEEPVPDSGEQSRHWLTALPLTLWILSHFLCPPFLLQPGNVEEGRGR